MLELSLLHVFMSLHNGHAPLHIAHSLTLLLLQLCRCWSCFSPAT